MSIPGFTAETSLFKAKDVYYSPTEESSRRIGAIIPQWCGSAGPCACGDGVCYCPMICIRGHNLE
jgi:hypothetical protein